MRGAKAVLLATGLALCLTLAPEARAEVVWLCEPGAAGNPCEIPQDTTVQRSGAPDRVLTPRRGPREIDCFYVYPTVSNQLSPNADKSRDPELESIAGYQAARFSQQCRVYAPIYRQATLAAIATGMVGESGADRELAYRDVREAWREYLAKENRGRGVVLIGHSQGTFMLRELVAREIEGNRQQRRRLVSALLIGGNVATAPGELRGGDFERTPLCSRRAQVGCVVAYSTFAEDPPKDARFGTAEEGLEVACTDPRRLAGWKRPLNLLVPSEPFAPGPIAAGIVITSQGVPPSASTTWVSPPDRFEGACRTINGAHVLRLAPRPGSRRPGWFPEPSWGTHLVDVNITLDPLVRLVTRQAKRWTNPRLRLKRRCGKARTVVRPAGRELGFVRAARFKLGRRTLARDRKPPFRVAVGPRELRRGPARNIKAVATLKHGEPRRLALKRRACR
jgi:hypothetical protein